MAVSLGGERQGGGEDRLRGDDGRGEVDSGLFCLRRGILAESSLYDGAGGARGESAVHGAVRAVP